RRIQKWRRGPCDQLQLCRNSIRKCSHRIDFERNLPDAILQRRSRGVKNPDESVSQCDISAETRHASTGCTVYFPEGLESIRRHQTPFESNRISVEGLECTVENSDGQTYELPRYRHAYGTTRCVACYRYGYWMQPCCVSHSMPSCNSVVRCDWGLSLGSHSQNSDNRLGSRSN